MLLSNTPEVVNSNLTPEIIFSGISAISALISIIAILILIVERIEKNRPYLQVSFEMIRSTLACVVLRNVGDVPIKVKSVLFCKEFVEQLSQSKQEALAQKEEMKIDIFPHQYFVIALDVNVFNIINDFSVKELEIKYKYSKLGKAKIYQDKTTIDYTEYGGFLVYVSELDELKQSTEKNAKVLENSIKAVTMKITEFQDSFEKHTIFSPEKNTPEITNRSSSKK